MTDGVKPISGAAITYNNTYKTTDANGLAVFTNVLYSSSITYSITAKGFKDNLVTFDVMNDVTKTVVLSTNTSAIEVEKSISVYPNPVSDFFVIENLEDGSQIAVYDLQGTCIGERVSVGSSFTFDMSPLPSGIYLVRISTDKMNLIKKITKQ